MKPARLAVILCLSVLAGCSEAPVYKKPVIAEPQTYKGSTTIWQPARPADKQPRGDWWLGYQDATLNSLIVRLDTANADLAVATANFERATAYAQQAQADLFPTISAGSFVTRNGQSDNRALRSKSQPNVYGDNALGLIGNYEVDLWGRVRNNIKAGEAGAQAAAADRESIRLSLMATLANSYLTLRMLDAQSKLLADEHDDYARALKLTEDRFRGGVDSALDVSRAHIQLDTTKAKAIEIAASRALYEHAIATLVGESASNFSIAPAIVDIQLPSIPVGLPAELLQRRPDIAAAERRLAEANVRIGVAKAAFFPTVNLSAAAGYESTYQAAWLTAPNLFWMIGPNALMTIFDAGRREAVVKQSEATFKVAGAQYRSTVLHAFEEVEDNLTLLKDLSEESQALNEAIVNTNHALEIAMNRYREGVASYLDVVTAQAQAQKVQLDELNLRSRRLEASVNLIRALGGGWSPALVATK